MLELNYAELNLYLVSDKSPSMLFGMLMLSEDAASSASKSATIAVHLHRRKRKKKLMMNREIIRSGLVEKPGDEHGFRAFRMSFPDVKRSNSVHIGDAASPTAPFCLVALRYFVGGICPHQLFFISTTSGFVTSD